MTVERAMMTNPSWIEAASRLAQEGSSFVMVTLSQVRGHAPRRAGSKMLVTPGNVHGSIGGGNLEQTAVEKSRALLENGSLEPELFQLTLNPRGGEHGVQCCGGEVTVLLEPVQARRPRVAIFGAGHVGRALVQVLGMLPVDIDLIDSREAQLEPGALPTPPTARLHPQHAPVPETALEPLPPGTHLLVLTHDHAEDIAILERALRRDDWGFIGLIGSSAKWSHFRGELKKQGLMDDDLQRVTTPIGLPGVPGKSPAAIAIATAAQLLSYLDLPETSF